MSQFWTPARYAEFRCPHGVGHPVSGGTHGCDGCCSRPDFPTTRVGRAVTLLDVLAYDAMRDEVQPESEV